MAYICSTGFVHGSPLFTGLQKVDVVYLTAIHYIRGDDISRMPMQNSPFSSSVRMSNYGFTVRLLYHHATPAIVSQSQTLLGRGGGRVWLVRVGLAGAYIQDRA